MTKESAADMPGRKTTSEQEEEEEEGGEEEEGQEGEEEEEIVVLDTESLIIAMERVTVLFDRSVEVLCLFWSDV